MNNFEFSPADGLMNKTSFPTNLGSETEARQQFMTLFNQIKTFINDDIKADVNNLKGNGSLAVNGYKQIGDIIFQWGSKTLTPDNSSTVTGDVTLSKSFPNACLFCISDGEYGRSWLTNVKAVNKSTLSLWAMEINKGTSSYPLNIKWLAIGY